MVINERSAIGWLTLAPMLTVLIAPVASATWYRYATARRNQDDQTARWISRRRRLSIITLFTIPAWWSIWDADFLNVRLDLTFPLWTIPLLCSIFLGELVAYWSETKFLDRRWSAADLMRLALWGTFSPAGALLVLTIGLEAVYKHSFSVFLWLPCAGLVALIGAACLRSAGGFAPRPVKSGELYKRSHALAKLAGVRLQRISVVPFGRGRLTNAYGGWNTIAVTDDYGHWLHGLELDFVIGHELTHVKEKHALKKLLVIAGEFTLIAAATFVVPQTIGPWRVVFNFVAVVGPLIGFYLISRKCEYAADRGGVHLANDAAAAVRALTNMYRHAGLPPQRAWLQALFSTHPDLNHRIDAIARIDAPEIARSSGSAQGVARSGH